MGGNRPRSNRPLQSHCVFAGTASKGWLGRVRRLGWPGSSAASPRMFRPVGSLRSTTATRHQDFAMPP